MIGSILWNAWFALLGFSLYFFLSLQSRSPFQILVESFACAIIFFFVMFGIRTGITVSTKEYENDEDKLESDHTQMNEMSNPEQDTVIENENEETQTTMQSPNDEEVAKVVKQMLAQDD